MSDTIECPECQNETTIESMELWEVYDDDGKETEFVCDGCGNSVIIISEITGWRFDVQMSDD